MNLRNIVIAASLFAAAVSSAQDASYWGYTDESGCKRSIGRKFNSGTEQGFAIKISKEKAGLLRGKKIVGLRALFSTTQVKNVKGFVTSQLGGPNDCEMSVSSIAPRFTDYKFAEPYTITGDKDLYVGFTLDFTGQGLSVMSYDSASDLPSGIAWGYTENGWESVSYGGAPALLVVLDEMPSYSDALLKPMSLGSFYVAGKTYSFSGQINNPGTETIKSLDLSVKIGDNQPVVKHLENLDLKPNRNHDFTIDDCYVSESGNLSFDISIANVNGKEDADNSDNIMSESKFIYPENFKKNVLLEIFTGMGCLNCPDGHKVVESAIAGADDVVLVEHHTYSSGDNLSVTESMNYLWYFNSDMTYAPGAMCNRTPYDNAVTTPVVQANSTPHVNAILSSARNMAPYASVDLETAFDKATRQLTATVTVNTVEKPLLSDNRINLFITQSGISGDDFAQSGAGGSYVHNHALRVSLTDVWGENITLTPGEKITKKYTYTLPEEIISTASPGNYSLATNPDNMQVVAFVMGITDSPDKNLVYNVAAAPLAPTSSGIDDLLDTDTDITISVSGGKVYVSGSVKDVCIYNVSGELVAAESTVASLPEGLYIVKAVTASGEKVTKKVIVK